MITAEAPIDDATFVLLHELWTAALDQARDTDRGGPLDGICFRFDDRDRSAAVCTPQEGTKAAALVGVAIALYDYARANKSDRARAYSVMQEKARATRVRFGVPAR